MDKRPIRRKFNDNPYILESIEKKEIYIINFKDYKGELHSVQVDKKVFDVFDENEKYENARFFEYSKHLLHEELNEETVAADYSIEDELINLGQLSRGNSLELLSDAMLTKLRSLKDKNVAAEVLSRAIRTTIGDIGKINLTLQEKFSTKFNKLVDAYNERTDLADIEKIIEELIKLKKEIEDELEKGNEYDLSDEEKAFFDALGADPEVKALMQDETLVQIAKELVEIINENLTLDAFKREDARARIRVNIRRLLIKYNYPPIKREGAVEQVIRQAELKYQDA